MRSTASEDRCRPSTLAPRLLTWTLVALGTGLASCAGVPLTESGFLDDYSALEPAPEEEVWGIPDTVHLYRAGALDAGGYDSILVDASVWLPSDDHEHRPSEERTTALLEEFTRCLEKGLSEDFEIVDTPRSGTLRVRPALTAVDPANPWLNVPLLILVLPVDMGGLSGEIEVVDAMSGERVLAMTARRESNPFLIFEFFSWYGQVEHGMWKWSRLLARQLQPAE